MKEERAEVTVVRWNIISILGWANIVLAIITLLPAMFGFIGYWVWGGIGGLITGAVLLTFAGLKIRTIEVHKSIKVSLKK